jgi:hypothetical protein
MIVEGERLDAFRPDAKKPEQSASTYARNYWGAERPLGGLTIREWIRLASVRAENPLSRQPLITFLEASADRFHEADPTDAESLGVLIGRLQGVGPIRAFLRAPGQADWLGSLVVGIAKSWRNGLNVVALALESPIRGAMVAFVPTLTRALRADDAETRAAALSALTTVASLGNQDAFQAIERRCHAKNIDNDELRGVVRALLEAGVSVLERPVARSSLQLWVDVAVALVDVAAKTSSLDFLNTALAQLDPEVLPVEVSLALIATSRPVADDLAARKMFCQHFEQALRTRRHPNIDKLLPFAK